MKVMLINPPILIEKTDTYTESYGAFPPIGLGYLASSLELAGHKVAILDCVAEGFENLHHEHDEFYRVGLDWPEIIDLISRFRPDVVGVSMMFTKNASVAYELVRWIHDSMKCTIIAGGVHATVMPKHVMDNCPVDYILKGEAEHSLMVLVSRLSDGCDLGLIDGLVRRSPDGIIENKKIGFIENLDRLSFPAYDLMNMELYAKIDKPYWQDQHTRQSPAFPIITSRSCPANCCFCETHKTMGPKWRSRSPNDVMDEITELVERYGMKEIMILDDNILVDKERAMTLFDMIERSGLDLTIRPVNGISLWNMTPELMRKMRSCGFYKLDLAVESGNKRVLRDIIHKPLDLDRVPPLVSLAKAIGFETLAMFVIGLPGETKAEIQDTVDFAEKLDVDRVVFSIATPFPGTELYDVCMKMGLISELDIDHLRFGRATISTPEFTKEYLEDVRRQEWVRINYTRKGLKPPN